MTHWAGSVCAHSLSREGSFGTSAAHLGGREDLGFCSWDESFSGFCADTKDLGAGRTAWEGICVYPLKESSVQHLKVSLLSVISPP